MGMFFNSMRKPRGFNHQYIYVNERKEKLEPVSFGIILIIIAFLLYLWHYLATGSWSF